MKLPALISSNIAAKLDKAKAERDRVSAVVSELCSKLNGLDVGSEDYSAASLTLDGQIRVHQRAIEYADRQIAGLTLMLTNEEQAAAKSRRAAAIVTVEKMLPERIEIIAEIEEAVKAIPRLFEKLSSWRDKFAQRYPVTDVEYPYAHFIDSDRILRNVQAALRTIRSEDVRDVIVGLAAAEAKQHDDLIADLKTQHPSLIKEDAA